MQAAAPFVTEDAHSVSEPGYQESQVLVPLHVFCWPQVEAEEVQVIAAPVQLPELQWSP